jgi:hypothetical protein
MYLIKHPDHKHLKEPEVKTEVSILVFFFTFNSGNCKNYLL